MHRLMRSVRERGPVSEHGRRDRRSRSQADLDVPAIALLFMMLRSVQSRT